MLHGQSQTLWCKLTFSSLDFTEGSKGGPEKCTTFDPLSGGPLTPSSRIQVLLLVQLTRHAPQSTNSKSSSIYKCCNLQKDGEGLPECIHQGVSVTAKKG